MGLTERELQDMEQEGREALGLYVGAATVRLMKEVRRLQDALAAAEEDAENARRDLGDALEENARLKLRLEELERERPAKV